MEINSSQVSPSALGQIQDKKTDLAEKLASGKQINGAQDNAAAQQIIDRLTSEVEGNRQALSNAYNGISLAQVAESGLQGIGEDVSRIRELTLQAGNGALNSTDREAIQQEITALQDNISQTAEQTRFAGKPLLSEEGSLTFQVGADSSQTTDIQTNDVVKDIAGLLSLDVTSGDIDDAIKQADAAQQSVGSFQAELGAVQNQLASTTRNLTQSDISATSSRSRIQDLDYAQAASQQASQDVLEKASTSVQAIANQQRGQVLSLLS